MYECSVRFGAEVSGVVGLQGQASALLASMNCLRLVEPQYAWVVRPKAVVKSQQVIRLLSIGLMIAKTFRLPIP